MEASSSAHHWARQLCSLGLDARIIAAHLVKPYRKQGSSGKNDANDAAAICEAASRPSMHFVPIKSVEQQSMLCVHRLREGIKEERTACINRIRGLLAEFGLVFAQSPEVLRLVLADVIEDASNETGHAGAADAAARPCAVARARRAPRLVRRAHRRARAHERSRSRRPPRCWASGPVTASAVVATVGDFKQFRNGAQFGAWIGLTPKPALQRRQDQAGQHHQARRRLPANAADPGRQVGGA